jgi:GrpB-like predicted nucleotidyltransferase (UPF0157 family)
MADELQHYGSTAVSDWLTQHPDVAGEYETLKVKLAAEYSDDMRE